MVADFQAIYHLCLEDELPHRTWTWLTVRLFALLNLPTSMTSRALQPGRR